MVSKMKRRFIVLFLILFVLATLFSIYINRSLDQSKQLLITELKLCEENLTGNTNSLNRYCGSTFPKSAVELYLCGKILSSRRVMDPIYYLYEESSKNPIYYGPLTQVTEGYFCTPFPLKQIHSAGIYSIKIYYFRQIIASINFSIQ